MSAALSSTLRRARRESPSNALPSGLRISQNMRATPLSLGRQGSTWNVEGSGNATMSDSSMGTKPWMDDPSKPTPSSNVDSSSAGVTAKDLRVPSTSVNQNRKK